ncbi:hypothetical protein ISS07_04995 [Candidatus Woesearchaeota archaeon]|nr:hypothetical protein [Candidatus Woesearchaeota archaeon]
MKKGKYTKLSEAGEVSYLGLFFPKGHPTSDVVDRIRLNILNGVPAENSGISVEEVYGAQQAFLENMLQFDRQVPHFAQDVTKKMLGDSVNAVVLTKGNLYDENNKLLYPGTIFPSDLGTNPWPLFKGSGTHGTIDDRITFESAAGYIEANRELLTADGCRKFEVGSSYVFFFDRDNLFDTYGSGGKLNLELLTADIIETNGYVGTRRVDFLRWNEAKKRAIPSVSYRQKHKMGLKSSVKLAQNKGKINGPKKQNADIIAFRYRGSESDVSEMIAEFSGFGRVGRFELQEIDSENYFAKAKKNGFRSFNLITRLISPAGSWPLEFQFQISQDYHNAEIDQNHSAHHSKHKDKSRIRKGMRDLVDTYTPTTNLMFPEKSVDVDI